MNSFLVVGSCLCDNIPIQLFGNREDALEFANSLTAEDIALKAYEVFWVSPSDIVCVEIVEFHNGAPLPSEKVRHFEPCRGDSDFEEDDEEATETF
jgi:hypothetical protein